MIIYAANSLFYSVTEPACIHDEIRGLYHFTDYKIILVWRRLQKKFRELFSKSFKGKDIRNEYRWSVLPPLWRGEIDKAVSFMENADPLKIKDRKRLKEAIDYLNRKASFIPDYVLRKALGLVISGNRGEKPTIWLCLQDKNIMECHGAVKGPWALPPLVALL
jgi:hypothetical protein